MAVGSEQVARPIRWRFLSTYEGTRKNSNKRNVQATQIHKASAPPRTHMRPHRIIGNCGHTALMHICGRTAMHSIFCRRTTILICGRTAMHKILLRVHHHAHSLGRHTAMVSNSGRTTACLIIADTPPCTLSCRHTASTVYADAPPYTVFTVTCNTRGQAGNLV